MGEEKKSSDGSRILSCRAGETEQQVGKILKEELGLTGKQISRLKFQTPGICVNGKKARITQWLKPGDLLEIYLTDKEEKPGLDLLEKPLQILYEDEDLLVVCKPAGILVHPSGVHYSDTLSNQVAAYYARRGLESAIRPIGRLDKDTSGPVLFAKNRISAARLAQGTGKIQKEYVCIVEGHMSQPEGVIEKNIQRCRTKELRMEIHRNGKYARTEYEVLEEFRTASLLKVRIFTGRTHQIRVHMAAEGHPLLGDGMYGHGADDFFHRTALHACRISFRHPTEERQLELEVCLPEDFQKFIREHKEKERKDGTIL